MEKKLILIVDDEPLIYMEPTVIIFLSVSVSRKAFRDTFKDVLL